MGGRNGLRRDLESTGEGTWPWECLGCGSAVYHDSEYCNDCQRYQSLERDRHRSRSLAEFVDWMDRETYPAFVAKITGISAIEIGLTTFWLHLLILGPSAPLPSLPPLA